MTKWTMLLLVIAMLAGSMGTAETKNPPLAAALSLCMPGAGQVYVGKPARGGEILAAELALAVAAGTATIGGFSIGLSSTDSKRAGTLIGVGEALGICLLGVHAWQTYDAYRLARRYNTDHVIGIAYLPESRSVALVRTVTFD